MSIVVESADLRQLAERWLVGDTESDDELTPLVRTIRGLAQVSQTIGTDDGARRFLWNLRKDTHNDVRPGRGAAPGRG